MPTPAEVQFIRMWRECAVGGDPTVAACRTWIRAQLDDEYNEISDAVVGWIAWVDLAHRDWLRESVSDGVPHDDPRWHLTSRGLDLMATADAIGFDPDAEPEPEPEPATGPEMVPCPDCDLGLVPVPGLPSLVAVDPEQEVVQTMRCPSCGGAGEVEEIAIVRSPFRGLPKILDDQVGAWAHGAGVHGTDDGGWMLLTEEIARALGGEEIELMRPQGAQYRRGVRIVARCLDGAWLMFDDPHVDGGTNAVKAGVGWLVRLVNPWVTEPKAMLALLRECQAGGVEVEAQWVGGDELRLNDVRGVPDVVDDNDIMLPSTYVADTRVRFHYGVHGFEEPSPCGPVLTAVRKTPRE